MDLTPHELKQFWLQRALASAGIELARWHPSAGVDDNRRSIEAAYGYYGRLFLDHPYLEWAGMASMIGPAFYAGFRDIGWLPDMIRGAVLSTVGRASRRVAGWAAGDLGFYETTFLTMQKKIFEDQASMHEAYLAGGVAEIEKFYRARIIDLDTLTAWQQIDRGRHHDLLDLDSGNRTLLWREQRDIIDRFYVQMLRHRRPQGAILTYLITLAGAPSTPGTHAYADVYPLTFVARLPRGEIRLRTPLAKGNLAVFADRWSLIETDTLPGYLEFVHDHGEAARALVATPISRRVARFRLLARLPALAAASITHWDLEMSLGPSPPPSGGGRPPSQAALPEPGGTVIDVTTAPTRKSIGLRAGTDTRVWMRNDRNAFDVTVALPNQRTYRARADMVLAQSSTIGGAPDRLTVRLPAADGHQTEQLLIDHARNWGFPSDAVVEWRDDARRLASSPRAYSTHVFTADELGFVHVEFQVAHHVEEHDFVTSALFSWSSPSG